MLHFFISLLFLIVPILPAEVKRSAAPATTRPVAAVRSDAEIERVIKARFARSKVNASNFQVRVQGGVATIEGATGVVQHKGAATRMAKTAGARAVVNNIRISDAARSKASSQLAKIRKAAVRLNQ